MWNVLDTDRIFPSGHYILKGKKSDVSNYFCNDSSTASLLSLIGIPSYFLGSCISQLCLGKANTMLGARSLGPFVTLISTQQTLFEHLHSKDRLESSPSHKAFPSQTPGARCSLCLTSQRGPRQELLIQSVAPRNLTWSDKLRQSSLLGDSVILIPLNFWFPQKFHEWVIICILSYTVSAGWSWDC